MKGFARATVGALLLFVAIASVAMLRTLPIVAGAASANPDLRYRADDGREVPFLDSADSYSWVRKASNYARTGLPCDEITDAGECRDTLRAAPFGGEMPYAESLHTVALAWLHRMLTWFDPARPVDASAPWLQVVLGVLGVLPGWWLGWRAGGLVGGFAAALLIGANPFFLGRSLGADNDVWNVVLPLFAAAAVGEALRRKGKAVVLFSGAAATALALHAHIWRGWLFLWPVLLAALLATALWREIRRRRGASPDHRAIEPLRVAAVLLLGVPALSLWLGGWRSAAQRFGEMARFAYVEHPMAAGVLPVDVFPDGLRWIIELQKTDLLTIGLHAGGVALLLAAACGLMAMLLPAATPLFVQLAALVGYAAFAGYLIFASGLEGAFASVALAGPLAVLLAMRLRGASDEEGEIGIPLLIAAWFFAGLLQSLQAQRFVLLLVAPIGLAIGGGLGVMAGRVGVRLPRILRVPLGTLLASAVAAFALSGAAPVVRGPISTLNPAWWENLAYVRGKTPRDAILHTWWHDGYVAAYFGERQVSMDGASVSTHMPHWFARALLAEDEREAVGLLRMLSCGSDLYPNHEARFGAHQRLMRAGFRAAAAYRLLLEIAPLDRARAAERLAKAGLAEDVREAVLDGTHCRPRPTYLLLTDAMAHNLDLRYRGRWDVRRAEVLQRLRHLPEDEATRIMIRELGYRAGEAQADLAEARQTTDSPASDRFLWPGRPFSLDWIACRRNGATRVCPVRRTSAQGPIDAFVYDRGDPASGRLTFASTRTGWRTPHTTILAGYRSWREREGEGEVPDVGVIVEAAKDRIVVGEPSLLRSMLARLLRFDGNSLNGFERIYARTAAGETVTLWRVRWPE